MSDNLYLFANNNGGQAEENGSYRLYDMKIEGDSEGVDSGVNYVDYLIGDGASWIDTRLAVATGYRVSVKVRCLDSMYDYYTDDKKENNYNCLYGSANPVAFGYDSKHGTTVALYNNGICIRDNNTGGWAGAYTSQLIVKNKDDIVDRKLVNVTNTDSMYIFANNIGNTQVRDICKNRVYIGEFKIWNTQNTLLIHLRPCLDTKGVPCMYDEVSKKYFYNKGTGTFKYKKTIRDFQPVLDSNNMPCLLDKINNKFYYNKSGDVFKTKEKPKYKKLKYIIGDGDNYIDLDKRTVDSNVKFEFKFQIPAEEMNSTIFRLYHSTVVGYAYRNGGLQYLYYPGKTPYEVQKMKAVDNPLTVITTSTKNIIGGNVVSYTTTENFSYTENLYLFNKFTTSKEYKDKVKLYYFKMYKKDVAILDLIPVLDQNNIPCMYDKVSDKFFYNKGTGTFDYEIEELENLEVNYVEYLEGDGNSWIDTEMVCATDYNIEVKFKKKEPNTSGWIMVYGVGAEPQIGYDNVGGYGLGFSANSSMKNTLRVKDNGKSLFDPYYTVGFTNWFNKECTHSYRLINATNKYPLYLFANDYCRIESSRATQNIADSSLQIFYLRITDASGNLVRDLRPCLNKDKKPCMYDRVSKKYFPNKGTGTFGYGDRVDYRETEYIESNGTQYIDTGVVPNSNTDIDMTSRLSAVPYYYAGYKCQVNTPAQQVSMVFELDFKYANDRGGKGNILGGNTFYVLGDGTYSLDSTTSTGVSASTTKYDKIKLVFNLESKKLIVYVNDVKIGEREYTSPSNRLSVGGSASDFCSFYTHYVNAYKLADMTPLFLLRPHLGKYTFDSFEYTIPKLKNILNGTEYQTSFGDALDIKYMNYGYDSNYIHNKLKLINLSAVYNPSAPDKAKSQYDKTVYEFNGVNTAVKPNLVASTGATLTMGTQNLEQLNDDDIETATNNGWSLV